ncbi:MAG: hypothetical protein V8R80_06825 [Eubacterium sp.]
MSIGNTLKKMLRWNVVSSLSWWMNRRWRILSPFCVELKERYEVFHGVKITDGCAGICSSSVEPLYL